MQQNTDSEFRPGMFIKFMYDDKPHEGFVSEVYSEDITVEGEHGRTQWFNRDKIHYLTVQED